MISLDTRPTFSTTSGACDSIVEHAHAWLDGELRDVERAAIEAHLGECARCRRAVGAEARFLGAVRTRLVVERAPAALRDRVRALLRGAGGARC